MSTTTKMIEIEVTTCDRPRCGRVVSEAPPASKKKQPAFFLKRLGKPDIEYHDLCDFCTNATDNHCDGIEKKKKAKPDPEVTTPTGDPPTVDPTDGPATGGGEPEA